MGWYRMVGWWTSWGLGGLWLGFFWLRVVVLRGRLVKRGFFESHFDGDGAWVVGIEKVLMRMRCDCIQYLGDFYIYFHNCRYSIPKSVICISIVVNGAG